MRQTSKKPRRQTQKAQLLEHAAQIAVPAATDVCVLGGGAAGLAAAIAAAEAGAQVVMLEQAPTCAQTILATGNGRCNFANARLDPAVYNDPSFVEAVCGTHWLDDVLGFFAESGLSWEEEAEGRLYPLSRQAASVRNVLLARSERARVLLAPAREVTGIDVDITDTSASATAATGSPDRRYVVRYRERFGDGREGTLRARAVIVATGGGLAVATASLGLRMSDPTPVLCPLACEGPALAKLDGRRVRARVSLLRDGGTILSEFGEVLFRDYGLSGIVVFDLSRHALPGDTIALDLLPHLSDADARARAAHTLDGILDPVVAQALLEQTGSRDTALGVARHLLFDVVGPADIAHAQVTRGGLLTCQFDTATLQAQDLPGLFACGEALDVDGPCGGFNLAWAWKSGLVAGTAAAWPLGLVPTPLS